MSSRNTEWFRSRFNGIRLPTPKGLLELNGIVSYGIEAFIESTKEEDEDYETDAVVTRILVPDNNGKLWKSSPFYLNFGLDNRAGPIYGKAPETINELFDEKEFLDGIFEYLDSRMVESYLVDGKVEQVYLKFLFVKYALAFTRKTEDLTKDPILWVKMYFESGRQVEGSIVPGETTWFYAIPFEKLLSFNFRRGFPSFSLDGDEVGKHQMSVRHLDCRSSE